MSAEEKKVWILQRKQTILSEGPTKQLMLKKLRKLYFCKKNVFLTTMSMMTHQMQPQPMDSMVFQFFKVISLKELKAELLLKMVLVTELFVITNTSYSELKGCWIE